MATDIYIYIYIKTQFETRKSQGRKLDKLAGGLRSVTTAVLTSPRQNPQAEMVRSYAHRSSMDLSGLLANEPKDGLVLMQVPPDSFRCMHFVTWKLGHLPLTLILVIPA